MLHIPHPRTGFLGGFTTTFIVSAFIACLAAAEGAAAQDCGPEATIADIIMSHHQMGGWTLQEMMESFGTEPGFREMILDAYSRPAYLTEEARQLAIREFVNDWTLLCYQDGPILPRKNR